MVRHRGATAAPFLAAFDSHLALAATFVATASIFFELHLLATNAPPVLPVTRLAFERHIYRVVAAVTLVRLEADGDFHLVLRTDPLHMIAEAPSPGCIARATPLRRAQMRAVRTAVRVCGRASITGVPEPTLKTDAAGTPDATWR